jgi:hypothetical protein
MLRALAGMERIRKGCREHGRACCAHILFIWVCAAAWPADDNLVMLRAEVK